jgi:HK97 family phage portal protein
MPLGAFSGWKKPNMVLFMKDFNEVPEVSAIINMKARAFSNMLLEVVSKQSGEEIKNTDRAAKILRKPNWFQGQAEYLMQTKLFREVFGNEYPFTLVPLGTQTITGLFTLPPNMVTIKILESKPYWLFSTMPDKIAYMTTFNGAQHVLEQGTYIHLNDNNATINEANYLSGISKLNALNMPIQNIRAAYEARNVLIEKRGALGILSNAATDEFGNAPFDDDEKIALQKELEKYGLTKDQWQIILTGLNLKWQQMAIDADKLKLFEETREDTVKICDSYGVPYELLGSQKGTTFRNKEHAELQLYQDTIVPEAVEWIIGMNRLFKTENRSWIIKGSYDHLPIFKEDMRLNAEVLDKIVTALSKALADGAIEIELYTSIVEQFNI